MHISLGFAGVMGGVTSMNGFLNNYFPSVLEKQNTVNTVGNLYCQYDSQTLQLMTSVLFISGAICELTGTTGIVFLLMSWLLTQHFLSLSKLLCMARLSVLVSELCLLSRAAYLSRYHGRKRVMM